MSATLTNATGTYDARLGRDARSVNRAPVQQINAAELMVSLVSGLSFVTFQTIWNARRDALFQLLDSNIDFHVGLLLFTKLREITILAKYRDAAV